MISQSLPSWPSFEQRIRDASATTELDALEHELFGRKTGAMTLALSELRNRPPEERKSVAQELNSWKQTLTAAIAERRKAIALPTDAALRNDDALDVTLDLPAEERGHLHLIPEFIRRTEEVFGRMGFDTAVGPEVEDEAHQFDLLNFPVGHAARDAQDIFYLAGQGDPDNRMLLRGHTSTVQIRYMQGRKPPFRMICTGKVYRKDSDATHSPMFHQIEGLMIGEDVTLANMKGVMETAIRELVARNVDFRWRTGYFPFVEPGLEMDLKWRGDEEDSREGKWLEIVGCGMVHPNVLRNCGIDAKKYQGFAFGFGVERMIMIRHQIPDLRHFFDGDLRFLRQF